MKREEKLTSEREKIGEKKLTRGVTKLTGEEQKKLDKRGAKKIGQARGKKIGQASIIDVCRKVARERNARTVLRFAPKTSHQSNGFVEAVRGLLLCAAWFDLRVETGDVVCAFMQADSPCEMFARHPKKTRTRWMD